MIILGRGAEICAPRQEQKCQLQTLRKTSDSRGTSSVGRTANILHNLQLCRFLVDVLDHFHVGHGDQSFIDHSVERGD